MNNQSEHGSPYSSDRLKKLVALHHLGEKLVSHTICRSSCHIPATSSKVLRALNVRLPYQMSNL